VATPRKTSSPDRGEAASDDDLLGRIDAVDLKHVLGDIQTSGGDLYVDGSKAIRLQPSPYCDSSPGAGTVHHINSRLMHCSKFS
jgi:hypothetical protein